MDSFTDRRIRVWPWFALSFVFLVGMSSVLLIGPIGTSNDAAAAATSRTWVGGDSDGPSYWHNHKNWSPEGVPTSVDDVSIACTGFLPVLTADAFANNLLVEPGAVVHTAGFNLTASGNVDSQGAIPGPGTLVMDGPGSTLIGTIQNLLIKSGVDVSLAGDVFAIRVARLKLESDAVLRLSGFAIRFEDPPAGGFPTGCGADLSIAKDDTPDPVVPGDLLKYTLRVANDGPLNATGVVVKDELPPGVTYDATKSSPTCVDTASLITCNIGDLAVGQSDVIDIVVLVDSSTEGILENAAQMLGNELDPKGENNIVFQNTDVGVRLSINIMGEGQVSPIMPAGTDPLSGKAVGSCPPGCRLNYVKGPMGVTLTAVPLGDSEFHKWKGDCKATAALCTIKNMDENKEVTAIFKKKKRVRVRVCVGSGEGDCASPPVFVPPGKPVPILWQLKMTGKPLSMSGTNTLGTSVSVLDGARNMKIELSRDGGKTFETLFGSTPDDGEEPWTVTGPPTNKAIIRVSDVDNSSMSGTSKFFRICEEIEDRCK